MMNAATAKARAGYLCLARYCGPADRAQGEHRGERVTVLREIDGTYFLVKFPCGTVSKTHADHLNLIGRGV